MTNEKTKPTYEELELEVAKLRAELAHLKRMIFGQKRERFIPAHTDSQMILSEVANIETTQPALKTETINYTRRKPVTSQPVGHGRQALPADLPRKEIVIEPEQIVPGMKKIRDEVTEVLEYVPPSFFVLKYIRPIYALPQEEGVVIGQLPSRPIDKGIAGPGFLAQILIDKYIDHLPLYRQWKRNQRLGIDIPESTMGGWVKACGDLLRPLYDCQKDKVLSSPYLKLIGNLILLGGKKPRKSSSVKRRIPSHFPIFRAPSHIRPPHRFLSAGKLPNQNLKIKQNLYKVCNQAISLQVQLAQK